MKITMLALVLTALVGCSKDKKPVQKPTPDPRTTPVAQPANDKQLEALPNNEKMSPTLSLSYPILTILRS